MTVVKVAYFGLIQNVAGTSEEEVAVPEGSSLGQLVELLTQQHGDSFKDSLLNREGNLRQMARINVDGKPYGEVGGLEAKLEGTREISILVTVHPMQGG